VGAVAAIYATELLRFWETGLKLAPAAGTQYPMCEADTFTETTRAEIQKGITQEQDTILNERNLNEHLSNAHDRLTILDKALQEIRP
jgi:hypothetical protein